MPRYFSVASCTCDAEETIPDGRQASGCLVGKTKDCCFFNPPKSPFGKGGLALRASQTWDAEKETQGGRYASGCLVSKKCPTDVLRTCQASGFPFAVQINIYSCQLVGGSCA